MRTLSSLPRTPFTAAWILWLSACGGNLAPSIASEPAAAHEPAPAATGAPVDSAPQASSGFAKLVADPERSDEDRALDAQRKPAALLSFFGIRPGQEVAELGAGTGYTAELLARAVAPDGRVYGQNSPFILEHFAEAPWSKRLTKPVMRSVTRIDSEFSEPFGEGVAELDVVLNVLFYHDTVWMGVDREQMNRAVFAALKPGGLYGIVDHSATEGEQLDVTKTLHRITEAQVIEEVTAAGFQLEEQASFLRNPNDTRDWSASPGAAGERRGQSDRFVLKFRKQPR